MKEIRRTIRARVKFGSVRTYRPKAPTRTEPQQDLSSLILYGQA
jgi:hypothetical protein